MIFAFVIVYGLYLLCILALVIGFSRVRKFHSKEAKSKIGFSVIIPFRNEEDNLPTLLKSISHLNYPPALYEILLINDASEDASEKIIKQAVEGKSFHIQVLQNNKLSNSPKKDAISTGIGHSKFEWIVTTDADCKLHPKWLEVLDAYIRYETSKDKKREPIMICGPVYYTSTGKFLKKFQQLDGFSLQAVTVGSFGWNMPILCNGANLAYQKDAFYAVNGFENNNHIASGDDIFLLEKMRKKFPWGIKFLKSDEATVITNPQKDWKSVIDQRVRWASKTSKQNNPVSIFLGVLVVVTNLSFLLLPIAALFDFQNGWFYLLFLLLKISLDYLLIRPSATFFRQKVRLRHFPALSFVYAGLTVIIALKSLDGKYSWKGRVFQNQN